MFAERQALEQLGLSGYVVFHRLVKIEVILRQIREYGRIEFNTGYAVQGQGMARYFHDDVGHALFVHERQEALQLDDVRRRVVNGQLFVVDEGVNRAENADMMAGSPQNMGDDMGRRRLAVRAGYADHAHLAARIIIKIGNHVFQRMMDIRHPDLHGALRQFQMLRRQDGDGAFFHSLDGKGSAVDVNAGNAHE